jgi:pimeloyl-ACP methyl ester carboxylesterase
MAAEPLQATTADGVVLRGELERGASTTWLVLLHDVGDDLDAWWPLRPALHGTDWNLLALDLRGHGGSEGEWDAAGGRLDAALAVRIARGAGAEHVCVVAAGRTAIAALQATADALVDPSAPLADSLVLLSPGPVGEADERALRGEGLATLLLHGSLDPDAAADAARLLRLSVGWTVSVSFATADQGTSLLRGPFAAHVTDKLGSFLREQAVGVGPGLARLRNARAI